MTPDHSPTPSLSFNSFGRSPFIYRMHLLANLYTHVQHFIELLTIEYNEAARRTACLGSDPSTVLSVFGQEPFPEANFLLKPSDERVVQETEDLSLEQLKEQLKTLEELGEECWRDLKLGGK